MKRIFHAVLAVIVALSLCSCAQSTAATWQEQYDLGVKYLSEGNYEEAIIAFNAAIEIDPKQEAAYVGMADAYVAMGDIENAMKVLEQAKTLLGETEAIGSLLDRLELDIGPESEDETNDKSWPQIIEIGEVVDVQGDLMLSQISCHIQVEEDGTERLCLDFVVDGPGNVREVKCAGGVPLENWTEQDTAETIAYWKDENINRDCGVPPFLCGTGSKLFPEEHGRKNVMTLIGTDENGDYAGISCVTVDIP